MESWGLILNVLAALSGALLFGLLFERIGLSWVAGCLVAGVIAGPGGLGLVDSNDAVKSIAEIGVALLLFTFGLEFSFKRLIRLGTGILVAGALSVVGIVAITTGLAYALGQDIKSAIMIGMVLSLGSTAIVFRILKDTNQLDSIQGRSALGILLVQDIAVMPLLLAAEFMTEGGDVTVKLQSTLLNTLFLIIGLIVLSSFVLPRLISEKVIAKNRELPILLAITTAIGATYAAHAIHLAPAVGAFLAGMLLSETKFSDQMRADILPLKTLFITVFFVSIGLLADPKWMASHALLLLGVSLLVTIGKTVTTFALLRPFQPGIIECLAAALALSQVGEFSFVIAEIAHQSDIISQDVFQLLVGVTLITLLATPWVAGKAPSIARRISIWLVPTKKLAQSERMAHPHGEMERHVIVVGYGDAGQAACGELRDSGMSVLVLDLNPKLSRLADEHGYRSLTGDATSSEILEMASVHSAAIAVVAVPDYNAARIIVGQIKLADPYIPIVARARYHSIADDLDIAGADVVVDEEQIVGRRLGKIAMDRISQKLEEDCRRLGTGERDEVSVG